MTQMSRRDWFRLKTQPAAKTMGSESPGLDAIAQPVNHDGMDLSQLPPMREALLSEDEVRELLADIEGHATNILLMQRVIGTQRAGASRVATGAQLRTALAQFLAGAISRVQIRYHWNAADWIDTLERRDDGTRLVRIAHATS